jgi:hypothetical protein
MALLSAIMFCDCGRTSSSEDRQTISKNTVNSGPKQELGRKGLLGAWIATDDNASDDPNATLQIGRDSIFYLDDLKSVHYNLSSDTISIYYKDFTFRAFFRTTKDSLLMTDLESGELSSFVIWKPKK